MSNVIINHSPHKEARKFTTVLVFIVGQTTIGSRFQSGASQNINHASLVLTRSASSIFKHSVRVLHILNNLFVRVPYI